MGLGFRLVGSSDWNLRGMTFGRYEAAVVTYLWAGSTGLSAGGNGSLNRVGT